MQENGGAITVKNDEGGIFTELSAKNGRYSGGTGLDIFLTSWSNGILKIDRVGRPTVIIPEARMTLALCVQPQLMRKIASNEDLCGRGMLQRCITVLPADNVGTRAPDPPEMNMFEYGGYSLFIRRLLNSPYQGDLYWRAKTFSKISSYYIKLLFEQV